IGTLLIPVASVVLPRYELAVLPGQTLSIPALTRRLAPSPGGSGNGEIHPLLLHEQGVSATPRSASGSGQTTESDRLRETRSIDGALFVIWIYLAGFLLSSTYHLIGWILLCRVIGRSRPLPTRPLRISNELIIPAVVGLFRPAVILPRDWRQWTNATRRAVLAHEFAHIRRKDLFVRCLARFAKCIFWFNPLVWWLSFKLSQLSEMACDAAAVGRTNDAVGYSRVLLDFAARLNQTGYRVAIHGLAMVDSSSLSKRIDGVFALSSGKLRKLVRPCTVLLATALPL